MSDRFDELVDDDVPAEERARLRRAHELLVAAGPAPALPASLAEPDAPPAAAPRRRRERWTRLALPLAAAVAAAALAGGYVGREVAEPFETDFVLSMSGTALAPAASASLRVGELDAAGNWPMEMTVEGLEPGRRYELMLTRNRRPAASCGFFLGREGRTVVYLNAPYRFDQYDGWVVTRAGTGEIVLVEKS
ncbi:MAG: hypothetical protein ICV64_05175 [Thermoleophilia bacterium]|nr:hypothetical protein [Thermoleophilia bacterium]